MPNYQNGKIYRVVAYDEDENEVECVGSTTRPLSGRMSGYRTDFRRWNNGEKVSNLAAFEVLKYPNAKIYLIHNYPCNSREELEAEEGRVIRERKCVNKYLPRRTKEEKREHNKERHNQNKEKHNEQQRARRAAQSQEKKDEINKKQRERARERLAAETEEEKAERNAKQRERYYRLYANKASKK